ncbi:TfoX/Sxy family protein [Myceligenerans crystallogenes]|uniref:TfoX N-terminal domain-containing protein n=1 Tax=Myceligenerans crystallogenes TaxID=316335 RepID=A0ABN2NFK7_9MICO
MAYDEEFAARVREAVGARGEYREISMFGGLCWTVNTHMAVGVGSDGLLVYVGKDGYDDALVRGARPMRMGERTMGAVVIVPEADVPDTDALDAWVVPAVDLAASKPPKKPKPRK